MHVLCGSNVRAEAFYPNLKFFRLSPNPYEAVDVPIHPYMTLFEKQTPVAQTASSSRCPTFIAHSPPVSLLLVWTGAWCWPLSWTHPAATDILISFHPSVSRSRGFLLGFPVSMWTILFYLWTNMWRGSHLGQMTLNPKP